jgi:predicted MFS family arabinose efflux permease
VIAPLLGRVADRVGRQRMLIVCLTGFAAANLLTAAAPNVTWLLVARALAGAMTAGISPSVYALVGESAPPAQRATWMATAVSGLLLSLSLGAPLGELAGASLGWARVFDALAGLSLVLVLANNRIWTHEAAAPPALSRDGVPSGILVQRLLPTVIWATALYGMYTYLGAWLIRLGFTPDGIARVVTCYGAGALIGAFAGGRIADRLGAKAATGISLIGLACGFALLQPLTGNGVLLGLGFGLVSVAAQIFFPAQQAGLVADFASCRATVLAWNNSALFLGIALGSLVGGQAVAHGSFFNALWLCSALAFAAYVVNSLVAPQPAARVNPS